MEFIVQFTVVIAAICFLSTSCLADSLCARKLSNGNEMIISFFVRSNVQEIPEEYRNNANNETDCVVFMELNWDEDVEIQLALWKIRPIYYFPTVRIVSKNDYFKGTQNLENRTITKTLKAKISGNTIRSFAVIYSRSSGLDSPFILRFRTTKARRFICPDLESEFGSVACSNGRELGSECTFKCNGSGLYPSPDLFNTNTQSDILKTFQSSSDPRFFSVCSLAERRRPAWKPEALTPEFSAFGIEWKDVPYYWKCVTRKVVEDVCLGTSQMHAPRSIAVSYPSAVFGGQVYFYVSGRDCLYPRAYLLSIFGEEKDGDVVTTTTVPTTVTTTTLPPLGTLIPGTGHFEAPIPPEEKHTSLTLDCSVYCKLDASSNSYTPKCGNYATTDEQIGCLTCRYKGSACFVLDPV